MDLEDGLGVEAAGADGPTVGEELGVETFEVLDAEMAERDAADLGNDVQDDVAPVGIPGTDAQRQLLGGQPPLCQVDGDGEAAAVPGPARVVLDGELRGEGLGVCAGRACGVPASAFAAGDRVEPFVDHRVVAVALACDVALHGLVSSLWPAGAQPVEDIGRRAVFPQVTEHRCGVANPKSGADNAGNVRSALWWLLPVRALIGAAFGAAKSRR